MKVTIFIALKSFGTKQLANSEVWSFPQSRLKTNVSSVEDKEIIEEKLPIGADHVVTKTSSLVSIALPKQESNYTVLRSPHIDKKSRDQFVLKVHKRLIIVNTEIKELRKKLFNLKFHDITGVQMKIIFKTKTRLNSSYL